MSAFQHAPDHIDALLTFAIKHKVSYYYGNPARRDAITDENATAVGHILLGENAASVAHRYSEPADDVTGYQFRQFPRDVSPVAILKGCDSLDYQSCEHDGWKASLAFIIVDAIKGAAITALPDYRDGEGWTLDREAPKRAIPAPTPVALDPRPMDENDALDMLLQMFKGIADGKSYSHPEFFDAMREAELSRDGSLAPGEALRHFFQRSVATVSPFTKLPKRT